MNSLNSVRNFRRLPPRFKLNKKFKEAAVTSKSKCDKCPREMFRESVAEAIVRRGRVQPPPVTRAGSTWLDLARPRAGRARMRKGKKRKRKKESKNEKGQPRAAPGALVRALYDALSPTVRRSAERRRRARLALCLRARRGSPAAGARGATLPIAARPTRPSLSPSLSYASRAARTHDSLPREPRLFRLGADLSLSLSRSLCR